MPNQAMVFWTACSGQDQYWQRIWSLRFDAVSVAREQVEVGLQRPAMATLILCGPKALERLGAGHLPELIPTLLFRLCARETDADQVAEANQLWGFTAVVGG